MTRYLPPLSVTELSDHEAQLLDINRLNDKDKQKGKTSILKTS